MKRIEDYFKEHRLFDPNILQDKCDAEGVQVITSKKYPQLVMLHYNTREVHFANKWTEFNRMCRGVIINIETGEILVHPFNKFFNLCEQPENQIDNLMKLGEFEVSEKLDGSMIMIFKDPTTGEYRATTKGSFDSEHGAFASNIIPDSLKNDNLHKNFSLMFELIERKFQIVINYEKKGYKPGLYLIGARINETGEMISFKEVTELAYTLMVPTLKVYYDYNNLPSVIMASKRLPVLEEGYVIRFKSNGQMVKMKGDEYLYAHRFISSLSPKYIIEAMGEGVDPQIMIAAAPEEYKEDVERETTAFKEKHRVLTNQLQDYYTDSDRLESRKEFAIWVQNNVPADLRKYLFNIHDKQALDDKKLYETIAKRDNISGDTKI